MMISAYDTGRKLCEKRRRCWLSALCPLSTLFSKVFFHRVVKSQDLVVKVTVRKQLFTSIFSFACNIFKSICYGHRWENTQLFGYGLTPYHTMPTFNTPGKEAFEKHCGKRVKWGYLKYLQTTYNMRLRWLQSFWHRRKRHGKRRKKWWPAIEGFPLNPLPHNTTFWRTKDI